MDPLAVSPIIFAAILAGTALFAAFVVLGDRQAVKVQYALRRRPRSR
jgi:hypothetical protein